MMHLVTVCFEDMDAAVKVYATDAEAQADKTRAADVLAAMWQAWPLDDAVMDDIPPEALEHKKTLEGIFPALVRNEFISASTMHPDLHNGMASVCFMVHAIDS